jgi:tripartite-type tricarboxylate transporter receptor subunit TctC
VAAAPGAHAQGKPKQALRLIVPLPPGSTSDAVARLIAERLGGDGGQPVLVENRPGASGRIAVEALKHSAADGRTLLLVPIAVPVMVPLVFKDAGFDPAKDLAPVGQVAKFGYAFAVAPGHPARSLAEFVAWAKAHPAQASFGTPGAGSLPHFLGMMVGKAAGTELVHVPYRSAAQVEAEVMGGRLAAGVSALSDLLELHRAGRLRILATSGAQRSPLLPAVPTFREQGYPTIDVTGWHAVYAPAGTSPATIDQLSEVIARTLQAPAVREKLVGLGIEPTGTTPEALAAIMAADTARWRAIVKASGFTAE